MSGTCKTKEPFVLRVVGDSMAPEFEAGSIIIIDPEKTVLHGDYAVAQVADLLQLGKLSISDGVLQFATTSNECSDTVVIGYKDILGRVVKRTDPRRRSNKEYI